MGGEGLEILETSLVASHVLRPVLPESPDICLIVRFILLAVLCGGQGAVILERGAATPRERRRMPQKSTISIDLVDNVFSYQIQDRMT